MLNDNTKWYMYIKKKVPTLSFIRMCSCLLREKRGDHVASAIFKQDWTKRCRACYIARVEEKEDEQDERQTRKLLLNLGSWWGRGGKRGLDLSSVNDWKKTKQNYPKDSVKTIFLYALAIASSCVSVRFLIITINISFGGWEEEGLKDVEIVKAGRIKAKKAGTHSEE